MNEKTKWCDSSFLFVARCLILSTVENRAFFTKFGPAHLIFGQNFNRALEIIDHGVRSLVVTFCVIYCCEVGVAFINILSIAGRSSLMEFAEHSYSFNCPTCLEPCMFLILRLEHYLTVYSCLWNMKTLNTWNSCSV